MGTNKKCAKKTIGTHAIKKEKYETDYPIPTTSKHNAHERGGERITHIIDSMFQKKKDKLPLNV